MNALILDRFNKQPLHLQFLWQILTAIGWGFWIYLWLPLLAPIGIYLGVYHGISPAESHWQQLTTSLMDHFSTVCLLIGIFMGWALLQRFGRDNENNDGQENRFKSSTMIQSPVSIVQNLAAWRQRRSVVVVYDEKTGAIQNVLSSKAI